MSHTHLRTVQKIFAEKCYNNKILTMLGIVLHFSADFLVRCTLFRSAFVNRWNIWTYIKSKRYCVINNTCFYLLPLPILMSKYFTSP